MVTTAEHIAIETLREIVKLETTNPAVRIARKSLDDIEELQKLTPKEPEVHHLGAADLDITKSPGGGA